MPIPSEWMISVVRGTDNLGRLNPIGDSGIGNGLQFRTRFLTEMPTQANEGSIREMQAQVRGFFAQVAAGGNVSSVETETTINNLSSLNEVFLANNQVANPADARAGFDQEFGDRLRYIGNELAHSEQTTRMLAAQRHRIPGAEEAIQMELSGNPAIEVPNVGGGRRGRIVGPQ